MNCLNTENRSEEKRSCLITVERREEKMNCLGKENITEEKRSYLITVESREEKMNCLPIIWCLQTINRE